MVSIKNSILLLAILFSFALKAQERPGLSFNHLALSVKDLERSAAFYKTVMELPEISNKSGIPGIRWFSLAGGRELHLILNTEPVVTVRAMHIAFASSSFEDILKRMNKLEIPWSDFAGNHNTVNIRADGVKQIYFQDPDGYWIEVNSVGETKDTGQ